MQLFSNSHQLHRFVYVASVLLLLPAFLINIDLLAFIDDEAIRALVALEMDLSENFITPTLLGEYYYNKPPLYNWLLWLSFSLFGEYSEWAARLPTVFFLCCFGATVFYFFKNFIGTKGAFLSAFAVLSCGRILFYDSLLGLIDICFSWVVFCMFIVMFIQYRRGRLLRLFCFAYLLAAIAFLLKGLPALVFLGFSLLAFFIWKKSLRALFTWQHAAGIACFAVFIGGYYLMYHQYNSLENVFTTLYTESSKRTAVEYGWTSAVLHLFTFPFEFIYHFLPWTLLVIYIFSKKNIKMLWRQEWVLFCAIIFVANIWVYWVSVEVYPRYLFMFLPLFFGPLFFLYQRSAAETWQSKWLHNIFLIICIVVTALSVAPLFLERTAGTPYLGLKTLSITAALAFVSWLMFRYRQERLLLLVPFLLIFRIGFNFFILPDRNANDFGDTVRTTSIRLGQKTTDRVLRVYKDSDFQATNAFYATRERKEIIRRQWNNFDKNTWYIINPGILPDTAFQKVFEIKVRHGEPKYRDVIVLK